MKIFLSSILLLTAVCARAIDVPPAAPTKTPPLSDRIQSLLGPHLRPTALPVALPNPFAMTRGTAELAPTAAADAVPTNSISQATGASKPIDPADPAVDVETLARCYARLRVGGTIEVGGIIQLIVNQAPYREGDFINVNDRGTTVQLLLAQLSPTEITLKLRDASQVIRLKSPGGK